MMYGGMGGWSMGSWMLVMVILSIVFLALLVTGILLVVRGLSSDSRSRGESGAASYPVAPKALDILDERFARG